MFRCREGEGVRSLYFVTFHLWVLARGVLRITDYFFLPSPPHVWMKLFFKGYVSVWAAPGCSWWPAGTPPDSRRHTDPSPRSPPDSPLQRHRTQTGDHQHTNTFTTSTWCKYRSLMGETRQAHETWFQNHLSSLKSLNKQNTKLQITTLFCLCLIRLYYSVLFCSILCIFSFA